MEKSPLPNPTCWIDHKPEGSPPVGTLLMVLGYTNEEEPSSCIDLGWWSEKLATFIAIDGEAIEERATVTHYHIVTTPKGDPFLI